MKIININLYTNELDSEREFYVEDLGFELLESRSREFTVKVGWSKLTFKASMKEHKYHYCFLIPSNKLEEGIEWLNERVEIIEIEKGRKTQIFDDWNAESVYFYDKSGNLAEFIVRYDLRNESEKNFTSNLVLGVNEIGMPVSDIKSANGILEEELKSKFWKGDFERFGTNGTQEGLFLLPNYEIKDIWFPTKMKIKPEPFELIIENEKIRYSVEFDNEKIKTTANNMHDDQSA